MAFDVVVVVRRDAPGAALYVAVAFDVVVVLTLVAALDVLVRTLLRRPLVTFYLFVFRLDAQLLVVHVSS